MSLLATLLITEIITVEILFDSWNAHRFLYC